jgi:hypothetical protein
VPIAIERKQVRKMFVNRSTTLDFARSPWYPRFMINVVRIDSRKHMTRSRWAVEGVVR